MLTTTRCISPVVHWVVVQRVAKVMQVHAQLIVCTAYNTNYWRKITWEPAWLSILVPRHGSSHFWRYRQFDMCTNFAIPMNLGKKEDNSDGLIFRCGTCKTTLELEAFSVKASLTLQKWIMLQWC